MKPIEMTVELARAAATDAGNRNMWRDNRTIWNSDDRRAAQRVFVGLMPASVEKPEGTKRWFKR